jgi:hypothetical protein
LSDCSLVLGGDRISGNSVVAIDLSGGGAADSRASQAGKILTATKYERTQEGALSTIKVDSEGEKL